MSLTTNIHPCTITNQNNNYQPTTTNKNLRQQLSYKDNNYYPNTNYQQIWLPLPTKDHNYKPKNQFAIYKKNHQPNLKINSTQGNNF